MSEQFVVVTDPSNNEPVELPTNAEDASLSANTLERAFFGAHGLKYKNPATGAFRALLLNDCGSKFLPPSDGWDGKIFTIVMRAPVRRRIPLSWRSSMADLDEGSLRRRIPLSWRSSMADLDEDSLRRRIPLSWRSSMADLDEDSLRRRIPLSWRSSMADLDEVRRPTRLSWRSSMADFDKEEFARSLHHFLFYIPNKQAALADNPLRDFSPDIENYIDGGFVTPISGSVAVTYRHGTNKILKVFNECEENLRSVVEIRKIGCTTIRHTMKVVFIDEHHDFVFLRSYNKEQIFSYSFPHAMRSPCNFERLIGFGLSHFNDSRQHITHRSGRLCSDSPDYRDRFKVHFPIAGGDSGGPCFDMNRAFVGMLVVSAATSPSLADEYDKKIIGEQTDDVSFHPGDCLIVSGGTICEALRNYFVTTGEEKIPNDTSLRMKRPMPMSQNKPATKRQAKD